MDRQIFFSCRIVTTMSLPKGTTQSKAKGLMTRSGHKPFVHVNSEKEFYRSYPIWKSKNPRTSHVYWFDEKMLSGNQVMAIIKRNMANASPVKKSPARSSAASTSTGYMTRSRTRAAASTSTTSRKTPTPKRRRKQSTPKRSYYE